LTRDAQGLVVRALEDPRFYPHRPGAVEHVQTHISHVFLAGPYAYKLKKAVRFPFLDFSTAAHRRRFCVDEVRLNRRLSPAVYLDVVPVTRRPGGALRLAGEGDAVEHLVWMRRLPAHRMLASLLGTGGVQGDMIDQLAASIAAFHAAAPTGPAVAAHADPERLRARWEENVRETARFVGQLVAAEDHEVLADFGPTFIRRHTTLLQARRQAGRIREGHGDLHSEHVCFVDVPVPAVGDHAPLPAGIYVFDCIEFSRDLRCNDVAYEVAFLAMDLESLDRADLGRRWVAAYAAAADDQTIEVLRPFYACHLACVRAKVEGLKSVEAEVEGADREAAERRARRHFALAVRYAWAAGGPAVIACCGLSGSGKTTLAAELASVTGFMLLGSDTIRRRTAAAPAAYDEGPYTLEARQATYEALCAEADAALGAGSGVVADATFIREADRRRLTAVARRRRAPCVFVECRADEAAIRARLLARATAPSLSDARWDTYLGQRDRREPFAADEPCIVVETNGTPAASRAAALRRLWRWRQGRPIAAGAS
jgi:aminoglycoside phosphotransferase family enzyme/predicted kinase